MSDNKKKIILSFDVELWSESEWIKPYIDVEQNRTDFFPNSMENILKILNENKAYATFFVTLEITEKYPQILKNITEAGHEIGVHGPRHIHLNKYTPERFRQDCEKQIEFIESITGKKPRGFRAAHFSLNRRNMWVLSILKDLGFTYDSSIFPINMGVYGISGSSLTPHTINSTVLEIPISVASFGKIRVPFAGGIYFRFLPYLLFKFLLEKTQKNTTPTLYFHPHELDINTPRITRGPILRRLLKYWGIKKSFKKISQMIKDFKCDSVEHLIINK